MRASKIRPDSRSQRGKSFNGEEGGGRTSGQYEDVRETGKKMRRGRRADDWEGGFRLLAEHFTWWIRETDVAGGGGGGGGGGEGNAERKKNGPLRA